MKRDDVVEAARSGWVRLRVSAGLAMPMDHIVPLDDYRPHQVIDGCWCGAQCVEDGDLSYIEHFSMDGREPYETGERRPH